VRPWNHGRYGVTVGVTVVDAVFEAEKLGEGNLDVVTD